MVVFYLHIPRPISTRVLGTTRYRTISIIRHSQAPTDRTCFCDRLPHSIFVLSLHAGLTQFGSIRLVATLCQAERWKKFHSVHFLNEAGLSWTQLPNISMVLSTMALDVDRDDFLVGCFVASLDIDIASGVWLKQSGHQAALLHTVHCPNT